MCDIHQLINEKLHARVNELEKLYVQLQGQLLERADMYEKTLRELIFAKQEAAVERDRYEKLLEKEKE